MYTSGTQIKSIAMQTKAIGIKKFRENITSLWKEAREKDIKYIVMHHNMPIFEVTPLKEKELIIDKLAADIAKARQEVKEGKVYTTEEAYKILGLK
ncbi:hypothetical protein KKG71_05005 [Patescibacteria group bacterium]|nr:hypothetical protein [Patescibacteria group bacterium]